MAVAIAILMALGACRTAQRKLQLSPAQCDAIHRAEAFVEANGYTSKASTLTSESLFRDINEDLLDAKFILEYRRDSLLPHAIGMRRSGTSPEQVDGWTVVFAINPAWLQKQPVIQGMTSSTGGSGVFVPDTGGKVVMLHLSVDLDLMPIRLPGPQAVQQACSGA